MSEDECIGLGGELFGHKFEPRYTKGPSTLTLKTYPSSPDTDFVDMLESYRKLTYIHDVCVRCGKVIDGGDTSDN